ncbi:MAG: hypothetical protein ACTIH8_08145, partial [Microbacterium gubbeenense]
DGNLIYVFHARTDNNGLTGRDMFVRRVHFDAEGMPVMDMEPGEELADERVTVTVEVTARTAVDVEAVTRCVIGKNVLAVTVTGSADDPSVVSVTTPFGERSGVTVGAGESVTTTFSTRQAEIGSGEVVVTSGDETTTEQYPAATCR